MKFKKPMIPTNINLCPATKDSRHVSDDDISNANTEDSLIARNSIETIDSSKTDVQCCSLEKNSKCGPWTGYTVGFLFLCSGILSIVFPPSDVCLNLRLEMTPGLPPYEWWKNPPDEVLFRVYIFNITNSEEFLRGDDAKLRFQEIGPIVFMEKLIHSNVTFNSNGTMTYTATRKAVFLHEMNTIDLNNTLVVPNLAVLGLASYLSEAPFFAKFGYNLLVRRLDSQPIVNVTIYDYLFNNSDPLLKLSEQLVPSLVPTHNLGILYEIYRKFENVVTVYIGKKHGHEKFFLIDKYDGSDMLPGYSKKCPTSIKNTTEGVSYPQYLTKESVLKYWRKTLCKDVDLTYESDQSWRGINSYKFSLPPNTYNRSEPLIDDCFQGSPTLPNGLIDVSPCYYNMPMAASFPHFMHADEQLLKDVDGLSPNPELHESYVLVEPTTGIPLHSKARSQSNIIVRDMSGFTNRLKPFSDKILPLFYIEYNQVGLPWYIYTLLYFTVNMLPIMQKVFSALCIILGLLLFAIFIRRKRKHKKHLLDNKKIEFETEMFLKV